MSRDANVQCNAMLECRFYTLSLSVLFFFFFMSRGRLLYVCCVRSGWRFRKRGEEQRGIAIAGRKAYDAHCNHHHNRHCDAARLDWLLIFSLSFFCKSKQATHNSRRGEARPRCCLDPPGRSLGAQSHKSLLSLLNNTSRPKPNYQHIFVYIYIYISIHAITPYKHGLRFVWLGLAPDPRITFAPAE